MEYNIRFSNHIIGSDFPALAWMADNSSLEICRKKILEKYHGRRTSVSKAPGLDMNSVIRHFLQIFWDILGETFLAIFLMLVKQ